MALKLSLFCGFAYWLCCCPTVVVANADGKKQQQRRGGRKTTDFTEFNKLADFVYGTAST